MTSMWRHCNKTHIWYSEWNSQQNIYFGFFIFGKLTELHCFVTYLSNDPRIKLETFASTQVATYNNINIDDMMWYAKMFLKNMLDTIYPSPKGSKKRHFTTWQVTCVILCFWCRSTLCSKYNCQQSHAHVHSVLGLTEVGSSLICIKVRAVIHIQP